MTAPPLVARAKATAAALGFERSCRDEDGMVMHVLAARRGIERVAEIGTGTGVGTAWLASALAPGVPLVTAELDDRLPRLRPATRVRRAVRRSRVTRARGDQVASDGVTLHRWEDMPKTELRPDLHRRFIATERVMLAQLYLEPGSVVPYHEHENEQLTYILEGTLRFWLGEDQSEVIDVHAGEVLHIPSWLPHKAEALERTVDVDIFTPPRQDWIDGTDTYFQRT